MNAKDMWRHQEPEGGGGGGVMVGSSFRALPLFLSCTEAGNLFERSWLWWFPVMSFSKAATAFALLLLSRC